jgi:hypothetical protein
VQETAMSSVSFPGLGSDAILLSPTKLGTTLVSGCNDIIKIAFIPFESIC